MTGPVPLLRMALLRPESFHPADVVLTDQSAVIVSDLLYDGLTEAAAGTDTLRPGLAERWEANHDFTSWTFHLGPEAVERLTVAGGAGSGAAAGGGAGGGGDVDDRASPADLVVDRLSSLLDGSTATRRAGAAVMVAAGLESVSASDARTVQVELLSSNAGLPWVLSGLPYSIVGPEGGPTGDYDVVSDDANGMILRRAADATGNGPTEVHMTWSPNAVDAHAALVEGSVDAAIADPSSLEAAAGDHDWSPTPTAASRFYVMNARSPTLADKAARLAVLAAIDRTRLSAHGLGRSGDVLVAPVDGLLAATTAGFLPAGQCGAICAFDPSAAAGLTGESDPGRLQLTYAGDEQRPMAEAIVEQLASAGYAAEANRLPPEDLAQVIVTGETDLFAFGWVAPATSSDAVIPPLLTVDSAANVARVDSPTVAVLLAEAAITADDQQRWQLLSSAHAAAMEQALIVPIATSVSMLLRGPETNWLQVRADGSIDLETRDGTEENTESLSG